MELDLKSEHLCAVYTVLDCKALEKVVGCFENNSIASWHIGIPPWWYAQVP